MPQGICNHCVMEVTKMAQFKERSNQAQGMLLSCIASQKTEISVPVFIPEANISHMVQAQQQSSIENLFGSVEHGGSASIRNDYEDDDDDSPEIGSPRFVESIAGRSSEQVATVMGDILRGPFIAISVCEH